MPVLFLHCINDRLKSGYPTDTYTNPNDKVVLVRDNGNKIGTSVLLKVMAGEKFHIRANAWWRGTSYPAAHAAAGGLSSVLGYIIID
ncbi:MAG: hypothetical protein DI535_18995 [Citrobacter freundii]|nr:MAG: hypothetical protein DI535_18995 [Citrobacter freundii]